jgi:hypothetical protein
VCQSAWQLPVRRAFFDALDCAFDCAPFEPSGFWRAVPTVSYSCHFHQGEKRTPGGEPASRLRLVGICFPPKAQLARRPRQARTKHICKHRDRPAGPPPSRIPPCDKVRLIGQKPEGDGADSFSALSIASACSRTSGFEEVVTEPSGPFPLQRVQAIGGKGELEERALKFGISQFWFQLRSCMPSVGIQR